jgi:hypothetical protein
LILDAIGVDWYPIFLVLLSNLIVVRFSSDETWQHELDLFDRMTRSNPIAMGNVAIVLTGSGRE